MTRARARSEQGSAFVLVLVLLTILSLALGAMFANAGANLTTSAVVVGQNNKVYAADGGVEFAIQQLRANSSLCQAPGRLSSIPIDGRTVDVSCQPTSGLATSLSDWALVTTETADPYSLSTQSGAAKSIAGPVYVSGGVNLQSPLQVTGGAFLLNPGSNACPVPGAGQQDWACTTAAIPDPAPTLPPARPATNRPASPAFVYQGCSIWKPGTYMGTPLLLGHDNYFASGIYYFEDASINLNSGTLVGGQAGPDYQPLTPSLPPSAACASVTDKTAGVADGSGVEFILGGSSTISVGNGAQLELFARVPACSPPGSATCSTSPHEGTPGISIRTVPSPAPWGDSTASESAVLTAAGDVAHLAVHGSVYVPQGLVHLGPATLLSGGLVCGQAFLDGQPGGTRISAQTGGQPRYVTITAQPAGLNGDVNHKVITSTAVVSIGNDPARSVNVQSWYTSTS